MNEKKIMMDPRELRPIMPLKEFQSFCRPGHAGPFPAFAVRDHPNSQKWTVYVFRHVGSPAKTRVFWSGTSTIPEIKHMVQKTMFDMGFTAISKLIQGKNEISCFAMPTNPNMKSLEARGLDAHTQGSGVIVSGLRGLTEYGGQTNSPGPEMVDMLVRQYDWNPRRRLSAVKQSCKLTGPENMAFIAGIIAKFGTPETGNE